MGNSSHEYMENHTPQTSCRRSKRISARKNYDENKVDELMEESIGSVSRKRRGTKVDLQKETETEAMIAFSLGFPMDKLLEEEIKAEVVTELGGQEQNDYIVVRNHILCMWRQNISRCLRISNIMETVSRDYERMVRSAFEFLQSNGYINFGVSPSMMSEIPEEANLGSVIVIGCGLAGLAAARQLLSFGFKVVILEGRKRPGGRVYTRKIGRKGTYGMADLGGSVITGLHANPLGVLARQLSLPLHKVRENCPLYMPDGSPVGQDIDSRVEFIFNKLLDKATQLRQIIGIQSAAEISLGSALDTFKEIYGVAKDVDERRLLDWHLANLEYANAGLVSDLSVAFWDQDDPYEMGGDHCLLAGGNCRLINALCENVPIFYGKIAESIRYGDQGVEVVVKGDQVFQADFALCTVPLGVLKNRSITFVPELPKEKLDAIDRLGFGLLNKVAMIFPYVFWGDDLDTFGCVNEETINRGEFFLFYSYHMVSGGPVLIALMAGEAAVTCEDIDPAISLHRVMIILKGIYAPKGIEVPDPIQSICTRWGSDPLSRGSYSHVRVGSSGRDYDLLAKSVGDGRLSFAGEATNKQYPATMHGAFLSGLREAANILNSARNKMVSFSKSLSRNVEPSPNAIHKLFRMPDMVNGRFSFVFDPRSEDPKPMGLMRLSLAKAREEICGNSSYSELGVNYGDQNFSEKEFELYCILSRGQAFELNMVKGGNESRLKYLYDNLGLKLIGRNNLGAEGSSLISRILGGRRGRGRAHSTLTGQPI